MEVLIQAVGRKVQDLEVVQTLEGLGRKLPDLVSGQDQLPEVDQLAQMRVVQAEKGTGKLDL